MQKTTMVLLFALSVTGCRSLQKAPAGDAGNRRAKSSVTGFVTTRGTRLILNGREYRAIGVNVPHFPQAYMGTWHHLHQFYASPEDARLAMVEAVADAQRHGIAFIRFFASPGYPKGTAALYLKDKGEYWRQMDALFDVCREHGVRLVPSLGCLFGPWFELSGEPRTAVLRPGTKTHAAVYGYVREFVSRYRDDPVVLMWEIENEAFLTADVNMAGRRAKPAGVYPPGFKPIRKTYGTEDSFRFDDLVRFYQEMATFIKGIDPNHLVTSGDSRVREESVCRRQTFPHFKWRQDTLAEHLAQFIESQPRPLDVFSIHYYVNFNKQRKVGGGMNNLDYFRAVLRALHADGRPIFVGELGQNDPCIQRDPAARGINAALDMIEQENVSLAALWVWHFPWHDLNRRKPGNNGVGMNLAAGDKFPALMRRIAAFNRRFGSLPSGE